MANRICMVVTSHQELGHTGRKTGYFLSEITHSYQVLADAGCEIFIASPRGGKAPADERSLDMSDEVNMWFMETSAHRQLLENTVPLGEVLARDIDGVFFAGGHGTMWDFPDNRDILRLIPAVWDKGGIVAAVCHGPAALVNAKDKQGSYIVSGRTVTAFTEAEEVAVELDQVVPFALQSKLKERGAIFDAAPQWHPNVVVSDRLITGQNPASARGVGEAMVSKLI